MILLFKKIICYRRVSSMVINHNTLVRKSFLGQSLNTRKNKWLKIVYYYAEIHNYKYLQFVEHLLYGTCLMWV